nr:MAG TPA: hypothetical protein [Caudoviricetes sp.]
MKNETGNRLFFYAKKRENKGNELDYIHLRVYNNITR